MKRALLIFGLLVAWATLACARTFDELAPIEALPNSYDVGDPTQVYWLNGLEVPQSVWMQANAAAGGTSVTVNLGGTQVNLLQPDAGNANYIFGPPFSTPASMSSPTWGNCHVYWTSPDSGTPDWGCALYTDQTVTATVNTQAGATGGCSANCVTETGGTAFPTGGQWGGGGPTITINGVDYFVSSVQSGSVLTVNPLITGSLPTQTGVTAIVHEPNTLVCSAFSSTVANSGWNSLTPTGCGTPAANTRYWAMGVTASGTQAIGRNQGNAPCPTLNIASWANQLTSFTSNASWPSNFISGGGGGVSSGGDGCVAAYMDLSYTTTSPYTITAAAFVPVDTGTTSAVAVAPPAPSGVAAIVYEETTTTTGSTVLAPTDGGDTFTALGSCPLVTGGAIDHQQCFYYVGRVTPGTTNYTCNFTILNKVNCYVFYLQGTLASGSPDVIAYDTSPTTSDPFSGASPCQSGDRICPSATSQANELVIGSAIQMLGGTSGVGWNIPTFTPAGSWQLLGSAAAPGNAVWSLAMFYQVVSSTGQYAVQGSVSFSASGSNGIYTGVATFK